MILSEKSATFRDHAYGGAMPAALACAAAALAIGVQRTPSHLKKAVKSAGFKDLISIASLPKRACTSGACKAFTPSALSRSTICGGRFAAPDKPNQVEDTSDG